RVVSLDQGQLPVAQPFLDAPLAPDRIQHQGVLLEPDQAGAVVLVGEAGKGPRPVLPHAAFQIGGRADVERPVAPAGHDVGRDEGAVGRHTATLTRSSAFVIYAPSFLSSSSGEAKRRPGDPAAPKAKSLNSHALDSVALPRAAGSPGLRR